MINKNWGSVLSDVLSRDSIMGNNKALALRFKISLMIVLIICFSLVLNIFLNFFNFDKSYSTLIRSRFMVSAKEMKNTVEYGLNLGLTLRQLKNLQDIMDNMIKEDPDITGLLIFDDTGKIIFNVQERKESKDRKLSTNKIAKEIGSMVPPDWLYAIGQGKRTEASFKGRVEHSFILPITNNFDIIVGGLVLSYSGVQIDRTILEVLFFLWKIFLGALVIFTLVTIFFINNIFSDIVRSLKSMSNLLSGLMDDPGKGSNEFNLEKVITQKSSSLEHEFVGFFQKVQKAMRELASGKK
jgi:hypothetical protein